nr:MAG TPA: hypothetical protein [Caudoviricetes sp.]
MAAQSASKAFPDWSMPRWSIFRPFTKPPFRVRWPYST